MNEKWDGEKYWLQAKIEADPDDVCKAIDSLRKDRGKSKELEDANKKAEAALQEVERLRKELELAKRDPTKITRYDEVIKELSATDWFVKAIASTRTGHYDEALAASTRAIQLNPLYALAYVARGAVHGNLGNHQQALADASQAIELDPRISLAYSNRSSAHSMMGNYP
jgi:tetratricopeptide (TPR) repeat protein